jgi:signal transduction histidine kinase
VTATVDSGGATRDPLTARETATFSDGLLRPFGIVAIVTIVAVQLVLSDQPAARIGWILFVPVAIIALLTSVPGPLRRAPVWLQVVLLSIYAVGAALLFPLPAGTYGAAFVFLASATAGQMLSSYRAAIGVALLGAVTCAAACLVASSSNPAGSLWWLGLAAGLPVYIGITRRQRTDALAVARLAAFEAERAGASEAREAALIERGRIAREIHDVLGHSLSAIAIQLDLADALQGKDRREEASQAVRRARALAREGIGETRRAVHALQEDSLPLAETLATIAAGFEASFSVSGEPATVGVRVAQTLIRATQEGLTNAHRHAPGAALEVVLDFRAAGSVTVTVVNGVAVRRPATLSAQPPGSGMGLQGMRERAELLGGTVEAGPIEGNQGWSIQMTLPR